MTMHRMMMTLKLTAKVLTVLAMGAAVSAYVGTEMNFAGDSTGKNPVPGAASRPFRVAKDYPSIQAAIDSLEPGIGGTVYIPEGRYKLDKALDLTRMNYHTQTREEDQKLGRKSRTNTYLHLMGAATGPFSKET